jgi:hypothetical protein
MCNRDLVNTTTTTTTAAAAAAAVGMRLNQPVLADHLDRRMVEGALSMRASLHVK